jgi:hypothetical protein
MRYQSWMLLFAGLSMLPHLAFSADGWGAPDPYNRGHASAIGITAKASGLRPYAVPRQGVNPPHYAEMAAQMHAQGYRFRPLQPARQARIERAVHYRPLQVQISERYVFRPLNPVARAAPPMRYRPPVAHYPSAHYPSTYYPSTHYPSTGYPMYGHGFQPYANYPYNLGAHGPYVAGPHVSAPWRRVAPASRQSPQVAYPGAVAQYTQHWPRFRPWSHREWGRLNRGGYGQRYAHWYPARQYPLPPPVRAYQRRAPNYAYPGYGLSERTAQQWPSPSARRNRYGTDWYDGRGDGEGAWYRLVMESAPAVSQSRAPLSGVDGETK